MSPKPIKIGKMRVTHSYDTESGEQMARAALSTMQDKTCPFCEDEVTAQSFGGALIADSKLRAVCNDSLCILEWQKHDPLSMGE